MTSLYHLLGKPAHTDGASRTRFTKEDKETTDEMSVSDVDVTLGLERTRMTAQRETTDETGLCSSDLLDLQARTAETRAQETVDNDYEGTLMWLVEGPS